MEAFIDFFDIGENHIVIATASDDFVGKISQKCKNWFADMGSTMIWLLEVKENFVFIAKHRRNAQISIANEKRGKRHPVSITQVLNIRYPD